MKDYRPDPNNPRQLTPKEARRLDEAAIDYSDIPELSDKFFAKALAPNKETIEAMQAAERSEVTTAGHTGADLIAALQASPCRDIDIEPDRLKAKAMTDAPLLFGEDWIAALLLAMVVEHCGTFSPEKSRALTSYLSPDPSPDQWLNSYNVPANADAMRELDGSEIEITEQDGDHIIAKLTPEGRTLLEQLRADQKRDRERRAKP